MVNKIGTVYLCSSNKGFSLRFCVDSWVRHETPEEGWMTYHPKHCDYDNKEEINSLNILSNNNYQTSSQEFWWIKVQKALYIWNLKVKMNTLLTF